MVAKWFLAPSKVAHKVLVGESARFHLGGSLRTADAFPVVASLPLKNSVCEPERQNDFRDVKPFVLM